MSNEPTIDTMPEDILTDFEEIEPLWTWHDELVFTAMLIVFIPVIIIIAACRHLKNKQQPNEQPK
jgi:hypothetical protein